MFCSQCGKKVMESMLFCPFCGSAIVIPDQFKQTMPDATDEANVSLPNQGKTEALRISQEEFIPLEVQVEFGDTTKNVAVKTSKPSSNSSTKTSTSTTPTKKSQRTAKKPVSMRTTDVPVKLQGHGPDLSDVHNPKGTRNASRKKGSTYTPQKQFNPKDIFLDGGEFDVYDNAYEDYKGRDRDSGGFFAHHMRGIVSLSLLLIAGAMFVGWMISDAGQMVLARANLSWKPAIYQKLGYQADAEGQNQLSGEYYSRALELDPGNYNSAYSAAIAFYKANNTSRSLEMCRKAITINPSDRRGYELLIILYPDADTRPPVITMLLSQGYRVTGDELFNVGD